MPPDRTASLGDLRIDPATPGFFLRPDYYEVLARLRAEAPVHEFAPGIKAVTRYHDIREISRDPERFCSGRGVLVNDPLRDGGSVDGSILHMDPPRHTEWRSILNREFTARALGRMEDGVRALAVDLLDALPREETVDLVDVLTAPLPVLVICDLLGVPESVRSDFRRWSDATIVASDGTSGLSPEDEASVTEMIVFLDEFAKDKAAHPADDIMSLLVAAEVEGNRKLTVRRAGHVPHVAGRGRQRDDPPPDERLVHRAGSPTGRARRPLGRRRRASRRAVEECLRWITPIQQFARTATRDTELGGVPVSEGDYLVMLYASGNRDEEAFGPTAAEFDLRPRARRREPRVRLRPAPLPRRGAGPDGGAGAVRGARGPALDLQPGRRGGVPAVEPRARAPHAPDGLPLTRGSPLPERTQEGASPGTHAGPPASWSGLRWPLQAMPGFSPIEVRNSPDLPRDLTPVLRGARPRRTFRVLRAVFEAREHADRVRVCRTLRAVAVGAATDFPGEGGATAPMLVARRSPLPRSASSSFSPLVTTPPVAGSNLNCNGQHHGMFPG